MARKLVMAAPGLPAACPGSVPAGLVRVAGQLAQAGGGVAGPRRRPAAAQCGPGCALAVSLDRGDMLPAAGLQPGPEGGGIAVAGTGGHRRAGPAGRGDLLQHAPAARPGHFIEHLQCQPPLPGMPDAIRDAGLLAAAARPGRGRRVIQRRVIPALRAEQPPVRRARDVLVHARCTLTPIWQLPVLPSVPEYCRATHGDALPSLGKPVSSITSASTGQLAANHRATFARTAA